MQDNFFCQDLTAKITPNTVVFPSDPTFESKVILKIDKKCAFNLCEIRMGNQMGTHIDFPAHVFKRGWVSSDYPLTASIGLEKGWF